MELRWPVVEEAVRRAHAEEGGPLCAYLYDLPALAAHARALKRGLPHPFGFFYAAKANAELPILQTLAGVVDGFEASSQGELEWLRSQFASKPLILSGPGKTDAELAAACRLGVELLHVESLGELRRLALIATELGRRVSILLRVNFPLGPGHETSLVMGGRPTQFGVELEQLPAVMDFLAGQEALEVKGLHFHLLSHQLDAGRHLGLLEEYLRRFTGLRAKYRADWSHLNVGGGIGINYRAPEAQFDQARFSEGLHGLAGRFEAEGVSVRFELGRYVTAACGYYAAEVLDIKRCFGETFVVCRGGTHHFRTPQAQGHSHPFRVVPIGDWRYPFPRPRVEGERVNVVGQLCTPKDVLAKDAPVERVRVGDVLLFPYAGAYAWNISHRHFLMHAPPRELFIREGGEAC